VGVAVVVDIELAALVARVQYGNFDHVMVRFLVSC
jgi:hypothetical protein